MSEVENSTSAEVFQFPGSEPRDPIATPWTGDVWKQGDKYRSFVRHQRRVECEPYKSYGRVLTHRYENVIPGREKPKAKPKASSQLAIAGVPEPPEMVVQFVRSKLGWRPADNVLLRRNTTTGRCSLEQWKEWQQAAELFEAGRDPDVELNHYKKYGATGVTREGRVETVFFEWGKIVVAPTERSWSKVSTTVYMGDVEVFSFPALQRGGHIGIAWGAAWGVMTGMNFSTEQRAILNAATKTGTVYKLKP